MVRYHFVLLAVAISVPPVQAQPDRVDPVLLGRVKADGRAAHERYRAVVGQADETYTLRYERLPGTNANQPFKARTERHRIARTIGHAIHERTTTFDDNSGTPTSALDCDNPHYSFRLTRKMSDAPYLLAGYQEGTSKRLATGNSGACDYAFNCLGDVLTAADGRDGYSLQDLQMDPSKPLLRARFTSPMPGASDIIKHVVWVDPENGWRVVELNRETPHVVMRTTVTYGREFAGVSLPSEMTETVQYKTAALPSMRITGRLEQVTDAPAGGGAYYLTAFSLPEPVGVRPPTRTYPTYTLLLVGAAALAVLAAGFHRLARWRASQRVVSNAMG